MKNRDARPILVTGSHRSGSTWVGRMIARSPAVEYIHEPFNILPQAGIYSGELKYWFTYICDDNSSVYYDYLKKCIDFEYPLGRKVKAIRKPRDGLRVVRNYGRLTVKRVKKKRLLIKDPLALFSAAWLARTFDMNVVVLIRHPAAFAGSLKQANWPFPFEHLRDQPLLMRDRLADFATEIEVFTAQQKDIIDQAVLLWNIIHSTILEYKHRFDNWYFVRHEDVSSDPTTEFHKIFHWLDLEYSQSVQNEILSFSRSSSSDKLEELLAIKRDSKSTIWNWKNRLTKEEIERIRVGTAHISSEFYDKGDW
ncbi:MAG: sulfotransferase [Candidatus Promineifilaceae bacterium]|nr:sulfotransferase [Candidatus Promineifilaceae bacterium]